MYNYSTIPLLYYCSKINDAAVEELVDERDSKSRRGTHINFAIWISVSNDAAVAELVDARDSKSRRGNSVRVRFSPAAPFILNLLISLTR